MKLLYRSRKKIGSNDIDKFFWDIKDKHENGIMVGLDFTLPAIQKAKDMKIQRNINIKLLTATDIFNRRNTNEKITFKYIIDNF